MAFVKPFKAVRPRPGMEKKIAALPYDVYSSSEARKAVASNPDSFLNIDRPETMFEEGHDMYAKEVYLKAAERFNEMISDGRFIQEDRDCFYIYELIMDGRSQTGIVGCASVDDYNNSVIKKHENTRADKELDRINHVDALSAQTGPIFLAYRSDEKITAIVNSVKKNKPLYDFVSEDGITHRVWIISEANDIKHIADRFEAVGDVYIADGHHRCASAAKVCMKRRDENKGYKGDEEFNSFLSVLFPDEELMIMDYNRVLKDLNGMNTNEVIAKLSELGSVIEITDEDKHPKKKGVVSFFIGDKWYSLEFKDELMPDDPVEGLDVSVLQNNVLKPLFGIEDPKTDKRIDFVGGIRGIAELEKRVKSDCKIAFAMYPTDISELFSVADAGLLMPPKSTWFEPKLRSGLFIHRF